MSNPSPVPKNVPQHLDVDTLSLLVDDSLSATETEKWMAHLEQCPQCRSAYEDLHQLSFALLKMETMTPPPDFAANIMANLPPQDQVDSSKTIEITQTTAKINPFAQINHAQLALWGAVAVLAFTFIASPPSMDTVITPNSSSSSSSSSSASSSSSSPSQETPTNEVELFTENPMGMTRDFSLEEDSTAPMHHTIDTQNPEDSPSATTEYSTNSVPSSMPASAVFSTESISILEDSGSLMIHKADLSQEEETLVQEQLRNYLPLTENTLIFYLSDENIDLPSVMDTNNWTTSSQSPDFSYQSFDFTGNEWLKTWLEQRHPSLQLDEFETILFVAPLN